MSLEVDTRIEAPDLVMSMAAIPLVTNCEPAKKKGNARVGGH
jgi:hypothetical protein